MIKSDEKLERIIWKMIALIDENPALETKLVPLE